jgi:hypothetical protein
MRKQILQKGVCVAWWIFIWREAKKWHIKRMSRKKGERLRHSLGPGELCNCPGVQVWKRNRAPPLQALEVPGNAKCLQDLKTGHSRRRPLTKIVSLTKLLPGFSEPCPLLKALTNFRGPACLRQPYPPHLCLKVLAWEKSRLTKDITVFSNRHLTLSPTLIGRVERIPMLTTGSQQTQLAWLTFPWQTLWNFLLPWF